MLNARAEATYARQAVLLESEVLNGPWSQRSVRARRYPKRSFCMFDGVPRRREVQEDWGQFHRTVRGDNKAGGGIPESAVSVTVKPFLQTFLCVRVTMSEMP